jgi:hypothetical protein
MVKKSEAYALNAIPSWCRLLEQRTLREASLACWTAGIINAAKIPMITMTTSISISVNPL